MILGYKNLYIHCKKNCLPLYLPSLIFISLTSCSVSRPYTITWRWHRIFHGDKNYVQRDEVVNSAASRQGNNFVTIEQVFYTSHALSAAGSDPNLSGAQVGFLHPLIFICLNPGGISLLWLRSLPAQALRISFSKTFCHELRHTAPFYLEQWFSIQGDSSLPHP